MLFRYIRGSSEDKKKQQRNEQNSTATVIIIFENYYDKVMVLPHSYLLFLFYSSHFLLLFACITYSNLSYLTWYNLEVSATSNIQSLRKSKFESSELFSNIYSWPFLFNVCVEEIYFRKCSEYIWVSYSFCIYLFVMFFYLILIFLWATMYRLY